MPFCHKCEVYVSDLRKHKLRNRCQVQHVHRKRLMKKFSRKPERDLKNPSQEILRQKPSRQPQKF